MAAPNTTAVMTRDFDSRRGLFEGKKLWFSQGVPQRTWLIQNAQSHGAQVVLLEQQADIKLVDHLRKNQAPGTHSYRYVELSIQNGMLEDLDAHRVGSVSRVNRPVGSIITASKGSRNKFTDNEDQVLWDWIKPLMDAGGSWKGLEIYKQLESQYPNHTFQSWRDRWIKHTQFQKRKITPQGSDADGRDYDQAEESSRSPKQCRIEQRQLRRANIGVIQSGLIDNLRQGSLLQQAIHKRAMGNSESLQASVPKQYEYEQTCQVESVRDNAKDAEPTAKPTEIGENSEDRTRTRSQNNVKNRRGHDVEEESKKSENWAEIVSDDQKNLRAVDVSDAESSISVDDDRFPLAYNFTQAEAKLLYKATPHILDTRLDRLDESWTNVTKEYGHTKEKWQTFFYDFIVPEYKRRHGIETEAELEAHYKEELKERRRQLEADIAKQQLLETGGDDTEDDSYLINPAQAASDISIKSNRASLNGPSDAAKVQEGSSGQARANNPVVDERLLISQLSASPAASADHCPPKPNESRKLSQARGSQPNTSRSHSQLSERPQTPYRFAANLEQTRNVAPNTPSKHDLDRPSEARETSERYSKLIRTDTETQPSNRQNENPIPTLSSGVLASQRSEGYEGSSSRFVTQVSLDGWPTLTESASEPQGECHERSIHLQQEPIYVSSRSVLEESAFSPKSTQDLEGGSHSDVEGSGLEVQLVEGEDKWSENLRSSEYAPSEVISEGITFESQIELSQAWETVPEESSNGCLNDETGKTQADRESRYTTGSDDNGQLVENLTMSAHDHQIISTSGENLRDNPNVMDESETTAAILPTELKSTQDHDCTRSHLKSNYRMETQALFQQSVPGALIDRFAVPAPPGGWQDENEVSAVAVTNNNMVHYLEDNHMQSADWILLPDPDIDHEITAPSALDDDEADIVAWLADQSKLYPSVPSMLMKSLSHRALESTSMDLDLANSVLAHMVDHFEKGNNPAHIPIKNIKKLSRQERKTAISRIANCLLPSHMPGCWIAEDDAALLGVSGREVKRVEDKHGEDSVRNRFEFLETWHSG